MRQLREGTDRKSIVNGVFGGHPDFWSDMDSVICGLPIRLIREEND
jgi:hypothetical protein